MKDILDFKKISFNELDDTDTPLQAFYNYDLQGNEIEPFYEHTQVLKKCRKAFLFRKLNYV